MARAGGGGRTGRAGGRSGGRGRAPARADESAAAAAPALPPVPESSFNVEYKVKKEAAITTIIEHPAFNGVVDADALSIAANNGDGPAQMSGHMAPFNQKDYELSMSRHGTYTAGCNIMHLDLWYKPQGDIPINKTAVESLTTFFFDKPTPVFPLGLQVVSEDQPGNKKGRLQTVSPMELVDALLFAIKRDIDKGIDEAGLDVWHTCLRSASFTFKKLTTDDEKYFASFNLREALMQQAHNLQHTAVQKISALMLFATRKELTAGKLNHKELAALYEKNVEYSSTSEKFTETYVKAAMKVWERLLSVPEAFKLVQALEESFGPLSPLNNTYVMESIVQKGSTTDNIIWTLE
eukprot:9486886-Pyramimonas_sp.AAC.2